MITILRNLVVKLTVGSISPAEQTLTLSFEDKSGSLVDAYRYTDEKDKSVVSCKYDDLKLTPGAEVLVLCDINYIHGKHDGSVEFKKVKLIKSQAEYARYSTRPSRGEYIRLLTESLLVELIDEARTYHPDRIAMASAQLGAEKVVLTEVIFTSADSRDAYVQGLKDARSHLSLEFMNSHEVRNFSDVAGVRFKP